MSITAITRTRPARWVLLIMAIGQLISPVFLYFGHSFADGSLQTDGPGEPPIVPAGYTFAIWAVICLLGAAYAGWQLPVRGRVGDDDLLDAVAWPLAGVFLGFSVWLVVASAHLSWLTVVVFATMFGLLLLALRRAVAQRARTMTWSRTGRLLLWSILGVYTGWTSVAVWVNLTTALADSGAPTTGVLGTAGQFGILVAATVTAAVIAACTSGLLTFAAAAGWALLGAAVGAAQQQATLLSGVAAVGLLALIIVTILSHRADLRISPSPRG